MNTHNGPKRAGGTMMKRVAFALLALLAAGTVFAQTSGTGTVLRNGYYFNATTGEKTDADGNAYTNDPSRDRDYSHPIAVVNGVALSAAGAFISDAKQVGEYTSLTINVQFNCVAADTDSVAVLLIPFLTTSTTGSSVMYPISLNGGQSLSGWNTGNILTDSTQVGNAPPLNAILVTPSKSVWASRLRWRQYGQFPAIVAYTDNNTFMDKFITLWNGGQASLAKATQWQSAPGYGGTSKYASINLSSGLTGAVKAPAIGFWVLNLSNTKAITSLYIDLWPKVN